MENSWNASVNCVINQILTWSNRSFKIDNHIASQELIFTITDTKIYVLVVKLQTDNAKLFEKLKSGFKRTINCNKYEPKVKIQQQNQYSDFLVKPSFQGVNRLFALTFQNSDRTSYVSYELQVTIFYL